MRVAIGNLHGATEEDLLFAKQLGVDGIVLNTPPFRGEASFGSGAVGGTLLDAGRLLFGQELLVTQFCWPLKWC